LNKKRLLLFLALALAALTLSACGTAPIHNWPGLAADAERAYLSSGSFVYAVDLTSGKEVWRYPAEAENALHFYANPVLTPDGQLLIGSAGTRHDFVSINPLTGRDHWAKPFSDAKGVWLASPLVFNDLIYAPNADGFLYILNLDGSFVDSVELGGALWSAPVTDGKMIYVASLDHHLHIIDPENPQSVKTVDLEGAIPGGPSVNSNGVYVGTFASKLEFVTSDAKKQTMAQAEGWIWGAPALDGETLYYADLDGNVYSLDLASGKQNWSGVKPNGPIAASPLVIGEQVFVATEAGSLVALDREGKIVWERQIGGNIYTQPVASGDLILVAPFQAEIALEARDVDGKQAWTFTPAK
jgi:outer membrane protein assembly factor BamB